MDANCCKLLIVGLGRVGVMHALNAAAAGRLGGYVEPDWHARPGLPDAPHWPTLAQALADTPESWPVVICGPTAANAALLDQALAAGRNALVEKPVALDPAEFRVLARREPYPGTRVMVGYNRRFDPGIRKLAELLKDQHIGRPHAVRVLSHDPAPPNAAYLAASGGLFVDMACHDLDLACYLLQDEPQGVFASGQGPGPHYRGADIVLEFAAATATVALQRASAYGYDQRVEVYGPRGNLATTNQLADSVICYSERGACSAPPQYFFLDRYAESYRAELAAFVECTLNGWLYPVTLADAQRAVELAWLCNQSAVTRTYQARAVG